jgi:large subunit ribosomal protein L22
MSPYKARPVVDLVRGKNVNEALKLLEFQPRRASPLVRRVIQSALANASQDLEVKLNRLVVADCRVDGGPLLGGRPRFMARAMGRAFPIRKRTCHILVTLAEGPETKAKGKGRRKEAGAPPPAAASAGGSPAGAGKKE